MINYHVDEKNGIVKAYFGEGKRTDWINEVCDTCYSIFDIYDDDVCGAALHLFPNDIVIYGKARCNNGDEFNVEIGKRIARNKLLIKYKKYENRVIKYCLQKCTKQFNATEQKSHKYININNERMQSLETELNHI